MRSQEVCQVPLDRTAKRLFFSSLAVEERSCLLRLSPCEFQRPSHRAERIRQRMLPGHSLRLQVPQSRVWVRSHRCSKCSHHE